MLEAVLLRPSRKMARCGLAEPFLASTARKTDSSALLKGFAGAWDARSGGDANPQESSVNNLGSFGTLTQKIEPCSSLAGMSLLSKTWPNKAAPPNRRPR